MNLYCDNAHTLIPSYLDGELSEDQAGPLRRHLLACPACREIAKGDTNLKRWFVPGEAVPVPVGFAARVARAALGADVEAADPEPVAPAISAPAPDEPRVLRFVLAVTAAAAAALILVSAAIKTHGLPAGQDMSAEPARRELPEVLRDLDRANREQVLDELNGVSADPEPGSQR